MINKIIKLKVNSVKKIFYKAIVLFIVSLLLSACSEKNINDVSLNNSNGISEKNLSEDLKIIKKFKKPEVIKDPKMPSGLKTTWQCVYFGSFPQIEVLKTGTELPIDEYASNDDVIYDDELYDKIINSSNNIETLKYDIKYDTYEYMYFDGCVLHRFIGLYNEKKGIIEFSEFNDLELQDDNIIISIEDDKEDLQFIPVENKKYLLIKEKNKDPNIEYYDEEDSENNN